MCGIVGFIDFKKQMSENTLFQMVISTSYRGPDDTGIKLYETDYCTIGFGHNRLSIIDLSGAGHQPMEYSNLTIVFNGEIYNYKEVKLKLKSLGHLFISTSDTEVILHAFKEWGVKCVDLFIGMFAFVIYDKDQNKIFLFRDRAGVKPLYYYWNDNLFLFGSELKAFFESGYFKKDINFQSVSLFMDYGYIPSPFSIFNNCFKLLPGHFIIFDIVNLNYKVEKYWDVIDYYKLPKLNISYQEAKIKLKNLLQSAFSYRMISDVPVGVFLSGGFDSAAVAAILQKGRNEKIKTFTIGFNEGNNEAPYAKLIADYLGTDHTEYYCTVKEAQSIIPSLPFYFDEPFADSSAIPTILVSKVAKNKVTVTLSADGGDEIFAGYIYYKSFLKTTKLLLSLPILFRKIIKYPLFLLYFILPNSTFKRRLLKYISVLDLPKKSVAFMLHENYFKISTKVKLKLFENTPISKYLTNEIVDDPNLDDTLSIALALDYKMYMQNDILTKVDRSTMSVSLEGREPFLDHRIIEFVSQLPSKFKFGDTPKKILKDIVYDYLPKELMNRPKLGFEIPVLKWLKNDLSYLVDEYLSESSIAQSGVFNFQYIDEIKKDFYLNKLDDETIIWKILQFQMWYKKWIILND